MLGIRLSERTVLNVNKLIFYTIFFTAFVLSGTLTMLFKLLGWPYRMALVSLLIPPLLLVDRPRIELVSVAYVLLSGVVFLSGIHNGSSLLEIGLFMRTLVFSFLIYSLVELYVTKENVVRIMKIGVWIAMAQLPVILLQRVGYEYLPAAVKDSVHLVDFGFGTFNFKGDAAMAFFLTLLVVFLLFDKRNYIVGHRWLVLPWLTVTVLIAHAEAIKPVLILAWVLYFATHLKRKFAIGLLIVLVIVLFGLGISGILSKIWTDFTMYLPHNLVPSAGRMDAFVSGSYSRSAALAYYLSQGIKLLGDGPSSYYNVIERDYVLGNRGHFFTFYAEVGFLGWLCSVVVFLLIAFFRRHSLRYLRWSWVSVLAFLAIQVLSYTTEVMNDISIVLAYCLILKTRLIPMVNSHRVFSPASEQASS